MNKRILAAASLVVAGLVAGCGSSSTSTPAAATVAGKVADGYLENASVFLDKNGNYRLDAGEPSDTTDVNGAYALTVDAADVGQYLIVALAVADVTIDSDNPGVPIAHSYLLSIPKESVSGTVSSNFISPMSTQVRELMETGNYATMQQAMEDLRVSLGLPAGTNLMADYIAGPNGPNPTMHTAAQNMATAMGGQMVQVFGNDRTSTSIDVNRYRGMMGTMFSNMSSVRATAPQSTMTELMATMTANITPISVGMPFMNMSTFFRGGMMGRR